MTVQDIKRGHWRKIEDQGIKGLLEEHFGPDVTEDEDGWYHVRFGGLDPLRVKMHSKTELEVVTGSDPDVEPAVARQTIRRYNQFLEAATGFNSKQRSKRLQKKAKEGKL